MSTKDSKTELPCTLQSVIARLVRRRWTKWTLIYIYNFSITNRSIEVRQHLKSGKVQFRVKRIAHPVHAKYFDVEDVKKALTNVL
jgi:hypothetical protein